MFNFCELAVAMEKCCLCAKELIAGGWLQKRKKLYGESANIARTVLEQCCLDVLGVKWNKIAENAAYLCHCCHAELSRLTKLKEELQTLKQSISDRVNTLYSSSGAAASLNRPAQTTTAVPLTPRDTQLGRQVRPVPLSTSTPCHTLPRARSRKRPARNTASVEETDEEMEAASTRKKLPKQ